MEVLPNGRIISDMELMTMREEARAYVKDALERASIPCSTRGLELIRKAIEKIVRIYMESGIILLGHVTMSTVAAKHQVEMIIRELIDELNDIICSYAQLAVEEEDRRAMLAYMKEPCYGLTTDERLEKRVAMLMRSVSGYMEAEASMYDGLQAKRIADVTEGYTPETIASLMLVSGLTGLSATRRLVESEVIRGWQHGWQMRYSDASFAHVYRGSSYPCGICDEKVGLGWQPIQNAILPPYHANCCCYVVYI